MSDFTSGPWRVNAIRGDESVDVTTDSGVPLQIANCHQGAIANAKADARLIAAAPDMFEALRDVVTFAGFYSGKMEDTLGDEALSALGETALAALARAEGRDHA